MNADIVVIGGGLVGSAIGYGLSGKGHSVVVLDGEDRDFRSAIANFGLVWLQGKGLDLPAYQQITRQSVAQWPDFNAEISEISGIDLQYDRTGGLTICLGEAEFEARRTKLKRLHNQLGGAPADWEMIDRGAVEELLPDVQLGPDVTGASYGRSDGHVNPLRLLVALQRGIVRKGGVLRGGSTVRTIQADGRGGFKVDFGADQVSAPRVVIAAGLGSKDLAAQVGLDIPIKPDRGQILVTERLAPMLPLPISGMRQTREGTVMLGTTHDNPGFDTSTTVGAAAALSANAIRRIPALSDVTLVRQWSGLRIMTPDTYPIYTESETHPGAFVALCHSGVTLAASHAGMLADAISAGHLPPFLNAFHQGRFDVQKAA